MRVRLTMHSTAPRSPIRLDFHPYCTVTVTVVELDSGANTPVTVTVYVPAPVPVVVWIVSVVVTADPGGTFTLVGLSVHVELGGQPV